MNAVARPILTRRIRQQAISRYESYGPIGYATGEPPDVPADLGEAESPAPPGRRHVRPRWRARGRAWSMRARSLLLVLFFSILLVVGAMVAGDLATTESLELNLTPVGEWQAPIGSSSSTQPTTDQQ